MNKKIDLTRYEGHTEGPWTVFVDDNDDPLLLQIEGPTHTIAYDVGRGRSDPFVVTDEPNMATANLIADAPLLLAEVKRLQKYEQEHKELWDIIANFSPRDDEDANDAYQEWLESVSQGYMGSVYEYIMMKQEEMIE